MRSRASSLPRSWCRSTYFSPPPATALACSASSAASFSSIASRRLVAGRGRRSWRVPQQPGGQVVEHLGGSSSDAEDPGVAVVPLHLGPVHVAGAAVELHRLVDDPRRGLDRRAALACSASTSGSSPATYRRGDRRGCRCGRRRPAGASRRACAGPPGWRPAACRRSRARGVRRGEVEAAGGDAVAVHGQREPLGDELPARSARSRCPPRRRGWPPAPARRRSQLGGVRAVPAHLRQRPVDGEAGRALLDDQQADAAVAGAAGAHRGGHEVGADAAR